MSAVVGAPEVMKYHLISRNAGQETASNELIGLRSKIEREIHVMEEMDQIEG